MAPNSPYPGMLEGVKNIFFQDLFLLREVSVYRDLRTGDILQAWTSVYTGAPTEVFEVSYKLSQRHFRPGCERPGECNSQPVRGSAWSISAPHKLHG